MECKYCNKKFNNHQKEKQIKRYLKHLQNNKCTTNMKNIGKKRDSKDKFYTNSNISQLCIQEIKKLNLYHKNDILIEPSAGSGSFSNQLNDYHIISYDIEPENENIIKQDFLTLQIQKEQYYYCNIFKKNNQYKLSFIQKDKKYHSIGNPPFGPQSSLAKKFIKKCCEFSDSISFILPKSAKKDSYQKTFPKNFHLIHEIDLPKNSFTIENQNYDVPCVFQIWLKKEFPRKIKKIPKEYNFKFIKKPKTIMINDNPEQKQNIFNENDLPDFGILRAGGGKKCGRISLNYYDGIKCYPEAWLFIQLDHKYDKDIFYKEYQKINWIDDSNVGARSIDKPTFIKNINKLLQSMD